MKNAETFIRNIDKVTLPENSSLWCHEIEAILKTSYADGNENALFDTICRAYKLGYRRGKLAVKQAQAKRTQEV